jgi:uncharacterized protein (TIGR00255 family)
MTGYGRKELSTSGGIHLTIEIRSVNNRFIDIQVKGPRSLTALEPRIKKSVQDRCSRGRFDVFISRNSERESAGKLMVDETLVDQYLNVLRTLKDRFGLSGEIDLQLLTSLPGLLTVSEEKEDIEEIWQVVSEGLTQALDELHRMRVEEGKSLIRDMNGRIDSIEGYLQTVHTLAPASVETTRKRISETLARLLNEPADPARLAQEIAILAERTDVTEELTRLGSHITQFRMLTSELTREPVGRKLDFLLQEMGREANTIASKAMNSQIAHQVVDIKAELEKIREQAQNIE